MDLPAAERLARLDQLAAGGETTTRGRGRTTHPVAADRGEQADLRRRRGGCPAASTVVAGLDVLARAADVRARLGAPA